MRLLAPLAKFEHIAQNQHLMLRLHCGDIVQRNLHTRRVGVVAIHYQTIALGLDRLRAVVVGREREDSLGNALVCHTKVATNLHRSGDVVAVVVAREVTSETLANRAGVVFDC